MLGLDDATSQDHDWGLRLHLFVPPAMVSEVDSALEADLRERFGGRPTRFAMAGDPQVRHRVTVDDVAVFSRTTLGVDASGPLSVHDWLNLTGQHVLEVTAGPVFLDTDGALTGIRGNVVPAVAVTVSAHG